MKKKTLALATAAAIAVATVPVSFAVNSTPNDSRATPIEEAVPSGNYDDRDVAQLLLTGTGPMATQEVQDALGFENDRPRPSETELQELLTDYLGSVPSFHEEVTVPFQSGNPAKVDSALQALTKSFESYVNSKAEEEGDESGKLTESDAEPYWGWMGANVAIYANAIGASQAVVYTIAGVATLALGTIYATIWYLPDDESQNNIDRQEKVASLNEALQQ